MALLTIKDLRLANYTVNMEITSAEAVAFWAPDRKLLEKFFDILAGINKNRNSCFFNSVNVFDNKEYFHARLYFDYRKKYLSTLKLNYLEERFRQKYNLAFDKDEFKRVSELLDIRGETEVTNIYRYTKVGNTFVNFALTRSLDKSIIIINNPTINLSIKEDIERVTTGLTDKNRYDIIILGPDNLPAFAGKLDKIVYFSNYQDQVIIAGPEDELIVSRELPEDPAKVVYHDAEKTIYVNDLPRGELRKLQKTKQISIIPAVRIEEYL